MRTEPCLCQIHFTPLFFGKENKNELSVALICIASLPQPSVFFHGVDLSMSLLKNNLANYARVEPRIDCLKFSGFIIAVN